MANFVEINYKSDSVSSLPASPVSSGASSIEVGDGEFFPNSGTIVFVDTEGYMQKLTYTGKSSDTFTGVSGWSGTGNLGSSPVYLDYYMPTTTDITARPTGSAHDLKQINYLSNIANSATVDVISNGDNTLEVESTEKFDTTGILYGIDTTNTLQKLTYTGISDETFTGVSGWEGSGNLDEYAIMYADYYVPSSTTITERPTGSAHAALAGSGYDLDDTYIFGLLHVFTERVIS
tara:strand:- start:921 stop:1622 length:702 start_codon:yes stop_codon:yes gene_type:complete